MFLSDSSVTMSDPNTTPQKFRQGSSSTFVFQSADRHTSQDALKNEFRDHIVFDVEFEKRMGLASVPNVSNCRKAIQTVVEDNLALISRSRREDETYAPWVRSNCSHWIALVLMKIIAKYIQRNHRGLRFFRRQSRPSICQYSQYHTQERQWNLLFPSWP